MKMVNQENLRTKIKKMQSERFTLRKLAEEAEVSEWEISRFVSRNMDLSEEDAERVYQALLKRAEVPND